MALVPWPDGAPAPAIPARRPSLARAVLLQLRLFRELLPRRFDRRLRAELAAAPRAEGRLAGLPVLVLPGMGVGDWTTRSLRRSLRARGFDARGWGLGRHRPEVPETLERILPRLESLAVASGRPVALVGWSLGGIVAREMARLRPDLVARVVTLGSPVVGGLLHTAIAGLFRLQRWDLDEVARRVAAANAVPIRVPVTAIWSRRDGIVDWRASIDLFTPGARNLEATSCHWGLGIDPEVQAAVATELARPGNDD